MNIFELTQLAEASYANLEGVVDRDELVIQLRSAENNMTFSLVQAIGFADNWSVITHQSNTDSGYSSTLFRNGNDGSYVLSFRGTEELFSDLVSADLLGIVGDGLAIHQIVDMYNEWQRIITAKGEYYQAARVPPVSG